MNLVVTRSLRKVHIKDMLSDGGMLMHGVKQNNALHDKQWGSGANRTSTDTALRKMMTFKNGPYMKITLSMFCADQCARFDQICLEITDITAQAEGASPEEVKCRSDTLAIS